MTNINGPMTRSCPDCNMWLDRQYRCSGTKHHKAAEHGDYDTISRELNRLRSIASDPDPEVRAVAIRARDALDELRKLTGVSDIGLHAAWYQLDLALRSD